MRPLVAAAALLALTSCGYDGAASLPLPGAVGGDDTYAVTLVLEDATNLVPKESCRANDTVVGSVESVELDRELNARVVCRIRDDVALPENVEATLRETSLLGERYVALDVPAGVKPQGRLVPGSTVPVSATPVHPNTEMVFGALSQVLNGGGLANLETITRELNVALDGRTGSFRSAARRLETLVSDLEENKASIVASLESLDRLSGQLADQRQVLTDTLDVVPDGLAVLDRQRPAFTRTLRRLDRLSGVAVPLIRKSKEATVADLNHLRPVLTELNKESDHLAATLERVVTFPFPGNSLTVINGSDYAGMYAQIKLDVDSINRLLAHEIEEASGGSAPVPPALPPFPQLPTLPGLPGLGALPGGLDLRAPAPLPGLGTGLGLGRVGGRSTDQPDTLADLLGGR